MGRESLFACILILSACGGGAQPPLVDGGTPIDGGVPADGGAADGGPLHSPFPTFGRGTGPILNPITLVTIVAANDTLADRLFAFGDAVLQSPWWRAVGAEYGLGPVASTFRVTGPAITQDIDRTVLAAYIAGAVADGGPAPNGRTLYLLFLPDGVKLLNSAFTAAHFPYPSSRQTIGDGFAVVQRTPPPGGETQLDALTQIASHEIIEAATDPTWKSISFGDTPAVPWQDDIWKVYQIPGPVEVGDLCEGTRIRGADGFLYQRSWSNLAAQAGGDPCVPALSKPYYNASFPMQWYPASAGQPVHIAYSGWSTGATDNWFVNPHLLRATGGMALLLDGGVTTSTTAGLGTVANCRRYPSLNSGVQGTLALTVPATAAPGDYALLSLHSFRDDPNTCYAPLDEDLYHFTIVGVYVP
jgi:hypothetical protein